MLQAFREEPALDLKCKDKFLILSAFVNEKTESMNLQDLVSRIDSCFGWEKLMFFVLVVLFRREGKVKYSST
jgi:hypothetical protein